MQRPIPVTRPRQLVDEQSIPTAHQMPVDDQVFHPDYHLQLSLSRRECEVLRLVAQGQTDRQIATRLASSPRTVNRHVGNILVKLAVSRRTAAVSYAIQMGLICWLVCLLVIFESWA